MRKLSFVISLLFCSLLSLAQTNDTAVIHQLIGKANKWLDAYPSEKIYLHFDKPFYAAGDTAWIKAYVLTGDAQAPTGQSIRLYVELLNGQKRLLNTVVLPVVSGLAQGYIPFEKDNTPDGVYTVRAYTNWLQNFGPDYFFYKQIPIGTIGNKTWLLTEQHQTGQGADSGKVNLAFQLKDGRGLPLVSRQLTVRLLDNGKPILKSDQVTSIDGSVNGSFVLPEKVSRKNLSIAIEDKSDKNQRLSFPFYPAGRGADVDLQFMPESGELVAGLLSKVGFKAVGVDGLGVDVSGVVVNSAGEEVASLQSTRHGMGSFVLVPQSNQVYTAKIKVNGKERSYPLPKAKPAGVTMRINAVDNADDVLVYITSAGLPEGQTYSFLTQARDRIYFGLPFNLGQQGFFNTRIPKNKFQTGIVNFTVADAAGKPVCRRSVFIDNSDGLAVAVTPLQTAYSIKDSISLQVTANIAAGKPVKGSFSISITDDSQVKVAAQQNNIVTQMLIASEVKGYVEDPAWYFSVTPDKTKQQALDNLLLTQAWVGYNWQAPVIVPQPTFQPEKGNDISGRLTNFWGKPAKKIKVMLLSKSKEGSALLDTLSGDNGRFLFKDLPLLDTVAYLVKLHNANDKSSAASIAVDEFKATRALLPFSIRATPWNVNTDTTLMNYLGRRAAATALTAPQSSTVLKQVDIKGKKAKLIGGEFATEIGTITEAELIAAKKESLLDLIIRRFPGFKSTHVYAEDIYKSPGRNAKEAFALGPLKVFTIYADGQDVSDPTTLPNQNGNARASNADGKGASSSARAAAGKYAAPVSPEEEPSRSDYPRMYDFLNTLGADDVKSISFYRGEHLNMVVTTRGDRGALTRSAYGTYAYRPLPMEMPRQFYTPKYNVKNATSLPDFRSTIHWEPNVTTDSNGQAKLSFYAADKPATYTVVIEGTDMAGHFGMATQKIAISQETAVKK